MLTQPQSPIRPNAQIAGRLLRRLATLILVVLSYSESSCLAFQDNPDDKLPKPNIILIVADDK